VAPQGYWNYPKGTEQTPTHAQETNMERQTKLVGITVDFHAKLTHHFHRILTHPGS